MSVFQRTEGKLITKAAKYASGTVGTMTISRPKKLNSLNSHLLTSIPTTLHRMSQDNPDLIGVILTGEGDKSFIAGADLLEMSQLRNPAAAQGFITKVHLACKAIRFFPVPVIARINGMTLGAGLEIAVACDLRVASSTAIFEMPEVRMGLPSVVEAALLPGLIGWGRTRRLLLLGETFNAAKACQWGLVEDVVEPHELDHAVEEIVQSLDKCGSLAVRSQKALIRDWEESGNLDSSIGAGIHAFGQAFQSPPSLPGEDEAESSEPEPERMIKTFFRHKAEGKGKSEL